MLFDISQLALEDSAKVQLKHPATGELLFADKEKTQMVGIEVEGKSSAAYREAMHLFHQTSLARKGKPPTLEDSRKQNADFLANVSVKGINFAYNGKELSSKEDFLQLYEDSKYVWVKDQVDEELGNVANFLK